MGFMSDESPYQLFPIPSIDELFDRDPRPLWRRTLDALKGQPDA